MHTIRLDQLYLGMPFNNFANFLGVAQDSDFWHSVWLTAVLLVIALPGELVFGLAVALLLHRQRLGRLRAVVRVVLVVPIAMTPVVVGLVGDLLFNTQFGVINYFLTLVGIQPVDWLGGPHTAFVAIVVLQIWQWTPFVALVLLASLTTVPPDSEEAATLDTKSWLTRLYYVQMPYLWPGITATLIFQTAYILKLFDMVFTLTRGGPGSSTELISLHVQRLAFRAMDVGMAATESVLLLVATIVLSQLYIRFFYREAAE